MDEFLEIVSALKDETRVKILRFLSICNEICVCELEVSFNMSQSRLSRHLKILKNAGFLSSRRDGKKVLYSIVYNGIFREESIKEIKRLDMDIPVLISCDQKI